MDVFEKHEQYQKDILDAYGKIPKIEQQIRETNQALASALQSGNADEFFQQTRRRASLENELSRIKEMPCNGTVVTLQEVKTAWENHKKKGKYSKALNELFETRQAFKAALDNAKKAFSEEVDTVNRFRALTSVVDGGYDLIQEMKHPRGIRWREISEIRSGDFFGPFGPERIDDPIKNLEDLKVHV